MWLPPEEPLMRQQTRPTFWRTFCDRLRASRASCPGRARIPRSIPRAVPEPLGHDPACPREDRHGPVLRKLTLSKGEGARLASSSLHPFPMTLLKPGSSRPSGHSGYQEWKTRGDSLVKTKTEGREPPFRADGGDPRRDATIRATLSGSRRSFCQELPGVPVLGQELQR